MHEVRMSLPVHGWWGGGDPVVRLAVRWAPSDEARKGASADSPGAASDRS